jgi:hypothetical protein
MKRIILLFIVGSFEAYSNEPSETLYYCEESNLVSIVGRESAINTPRKFQATLNGKVLWLEGDNFPLTYFGNTDRNIINVETDFINANKYGGLQHFLLNETHFTFIGTNKLLLANDEESWIILSQGRCVRVPSP